MFKIVDSKELMSREEAKRLYEDCNILFIENKKGIGRVYAISDSDESGKLADLQLKLYDKGVNAFHMNNYSTNNYTLHVERCDLV